MAKLDDIARELGLSKGTVSKALNGAADISEATRKAVLEKAVEMGYSRVGRNGSGIAVCIFVENMAYQKPEDFGYDIIMGFRQIAEPLGFRISVVELTPQLQEEIGYDQYMLLHGYRAGFFMGLTHVDPWLRGFASCRTPVVLYDNHVVGNPAVAHVGVDNDEGMRLIVTHLRALGHKTIGYLSTPLGNYVYKQRYRSFFRALYENGLGSSRTLAGTSPYTAECLNKHLPRLLSQGCTAIVCCNDMLASSVMMHCQELGLRVPGDVSVIGFDDIPLSRFVTPPLTTIRQNRLEIGKSAFFALASLLNKVHISTHLLHAELVERASSARAKAANNE
ncbi:MAG: LacI family DNA-binding transcriptional regulator [Clostridia bacterium]|nr:LacI family DNA-binding transcriptional regulator [Clostridia bacterium]